LDEGAAWWTVGIVKILINHPRWYDLEANKKERAYQVLVSWLRDSEVQRALQVNRYRGVLWFNHEALEQLLGWMLALAAVEIGADPGRSPEEVARQIVVCYDVVKVLQQAEETSEYQVVKLMEAAKG
jgi:acetolactate synthase regulatory subunit